MINKEIISNIIGQINKGDKKSPFLFLAKNSDLLTSDVKSLGLELLKHFEIPEVYLYILEDNGEKIKIKEVKEFINLSNSKPPYKFQIFFIENISRFTISAGNSLLKFFEEPDVTNIIFLSNVSESGILDTILSRVQTINLGGQVVIKKDEFIYNLIENYIQSLVRRGDNPNTEILSYYFRNKLEKSDYIKFLENLIIYSKDNLIFIDYLSEIDDDINAIKQNNVNAKYIVDKWLMRI